MPQCPGPGDEGHPILGTLTVLVHSCGTNPLTLLLLTDWATDRKLMKPDGGEGGEVGEGEAQMP